MSKFENRTGSSVRFSGPYMGEEVEFITSDFQNTAGKVSNSEVTNPDNLGVFGGGTSGGEILPFGDDQIKRIALCLGHSANDEIDVKKIRRSLGM